MKYSINSCNEIREDLRQHNFNFKRSYSNYISTTTLEITEENKLRLANFSNQTIQSNSPNSSIAARKIQVNIQTNLNWQRVCFVWQGQDEWVLVFQQPLQLHLVLKKYSKLVTIELENTYNLEQMVCFVNYPELLVYGHSPQTFTNHIYSINLTAFEVRELTDAKNYSPGPRTNYWAYFSDNRLYVAGGVDKNSKKLEQLLWTFNLESGYWFALEMPLDNLVVSQPQINLQFQSGKVLLIGKRQLCIVELYQSRVKNVEQWKQKLTEQALNNIKGVFIADCQIYLHSNKQILSPSFTINKIKETK